jgi:hypothetical protein
MVWVRSGRGLGSRPFKPKNGDEIDFEQSAVKYGLLNAIVHLPRTKLP